MVLSQDAVMCISVSSDRHFVSNDDVIYDLKGLNQYGCYSLQLKYSTNT